MVPGVDALVPAVPVWFPAAVIFFGIEFLLIWYFQSVLDRSSTGLSEAVTSRERRLIIGSLVVGYLFLAVAFIRQYASVASLSMYLFFLTRVMEGAASLRFFKKIFEFLSGGSSGASPMRAIFTWFLPRIKYWLLSLFVGLVTISLMVHVLTRDAVIQEPKFKIALIYTLGSFLIAVLGVAYRLRSTPEVFNRVAKFGIILCLAGAAIYDYGTLAGEFVAWGVGIAGYTVGFWVAAVVIFRASASPVLIALRQVTPF